MVNESFEGGSTSAGPLAQRIMIPGVSKWKVRDPRASSSISWFTATKNGSGERDDLSRVTQLTARKDVIIALCKDIQILRHFHTYFIASQQSRDVACQMSRK